jgi:hypothetical protein
VDSSRYSLIVLYTRSTIVTLHYKEFIAEKKLFHITIQITIFHFFFSTTLYNQINSSMTPPYFSSTSHKQFFCSSSVLHSAHENIKIRQYMFTLEFLFNYITTAKSSISDPFSIVGQYHLLINCYIGLFSSIRFWTFCFTYSISFSSYQWLTVHD